MRQGEVWTLGRLRVLVVSNDEFNTLPGFRPLVVPLVRGHAESTGLAVPTGEADHISALILAAYVMTIDAPAGGEADTTLSGQTMGLVLAVLTDLLAS